MKTKTLLKLRPLAIWSFLFAALSITRALSADAAARPEIWGCYALHYSDEDLDPSIERSFEGFVRGSPGGYGIWSPYMRIRDMGGGKNLEFLFFRDRKIDSISRIDEKRNFVRATPDGVEFVTYSGSASVGVIDNTTHRIKITLEKDGNLTVTVASERDTRTFWVVGGTQKHTYVLKMTRLAGPCNVPEGVESFHVLDVPGKR